MGSIYKVYEDQYIEIEVDEMSTRYGMSIYTKTGGVYPSVTINLFNNESIEAGSLAEMGYRILYAAFLQMDEQDIKAMKLRVANL